MVSPDRDETEIVDRDPRQAVKKSVDRFLDKKEGAIESAMITGDPWIRFHYTDPENRQPPVALDQLARQLYKGRHVQVNSFGIFFNGPSTDFRKGMFSFESGRDIDSLEGQALFKEMLNPPVTRFTERNIPFHIEATVVCNDTLSVRERELARTDISALYIPDSKMVLGSTYVLHPYLMENFCAVESFDFDDWLDKSETGKGHTLSPPYVQPFNPGLLLSVAAEVDKITAEFDSADTNPKVRVDVHYT